MTPRQDVAETIRQTAELRRLCVSLRAAKLEEAERALVRDFEQATEGADDPARLPLPTIRAGFRALWRQGRRDTLAALARRLPERILFDDETILMYAVCAGHSPSSGPSATAS